MNLLEPVIDRLNKQKSLLIEYMKMKIDTQDWHGVADIAMDLRDIESEIKGLNTRYEIVDVKYEGHLIYDPKVHGSIK